MTGPPVLNVTGPLLLFGGPYSNLEATQALLSEAARRTIPPERMICTGDVVAYGADARETAALIRNSGCQVVMGNCEESLASRAVDCGCGFTEGSTCSQLAAAWYLHADQQIDLDLRMWMAALPRRIDIETAGVRLAVIHGAARSINRFIFPSTAAAIKAGDIDHLGVDGVIAGHSGIPFTQVIEGRLWHNAGAIGTPANDGTSRVWYSILTAHDGTISIEHCELRYDYRSAARKMRACGLPEGYADALESGLWPSCDVLPYREIGERGVAIDPGAIEFRACGIRGNSRGKPEVSAQWPPADRAASPLEDRKFKDPEQTATGERRARVALDKLETLWINTGTLCNLTCRNCYIESSPENDSLVYITKSEVVRFLDEITEDALGTKEIGLTGGEPFMNPDIIPIIEACLERGYQTLVLTNAMRPMLRHKDALLRLNNIHRTRLTLRVSLDHYNPDRHEEERGQNTFATTLRGLRWLVGSGFQVTVAGRAMWGEDPYSERAGYARLFAERDIALDAFDERTLVLFPEMDANRDVPELSDDCWSTQQKSPRDVMCSSSRMVVKRKGAKAPAVVSCTLLAYDPRFELGQSLREASASVSLNHPYCAQFCVLGAASCSSK